MEEFINPFIGGCMIGLSATLLLLFNGRIAGISGILNGFLTAPSNQQSWRVLFLGGLCFGGLLLAIVAPSWLQNNLENSTLLTASGGLLVGIGTLLGSGCTSGHGVCGMSRLSIRSIAATLTFMFFGFLIVFLINHTWSLQ